MTAEGIATINTTTDKSYSFAISDSTLEPDLSAQLNKMIDIIEFIIFK